MLKILNEEGFDIKERELMRVRAKNRWLLRVPNGMKSRSAVQVQQPEDEGLRALQQEVYKAEEVGFDDSEPLPSQSTVQQSPPPATMPPEALSKREARVERLKEESAIRWAARKRRRRTRGWAGLPADPPGPPRFPSETTIDESKKYLSLDNMLYREIRDQFQKICEETGFIKKTIAGPERWQVAKDRLIDQSPHLQHVFRSDPTQLDAKALALDVVCTDVTKRMRTLETRMTIAEAKNALGINPEESRQIRNAFYNTLKADHFTSKLEAGDEHWKELKQKWIENSDLLQRILIPGPSGMQQHSSKMKALEVLCRDVMKRLRDDQTKRDPSRRRATTHSDQNTVPISNNSSSEFADGMGNGISTLASQALASASVSSSDMVDMQIDPSLLQAANDPSFAVNTQHDPGNTFGYAYPMLESTVPVQIPVYLGISSQSQVYGTSKSWAEKLATRSVTELQQLVLSRFPDSTISKIEGIDDDTPGTEVPFLIDDDQGLDVYLTHIQGKRALFLFCLDPA